MDAQKYHEVTNVCDLIAAKTQRAEMTALAARVHHALEQEHKPTMALVSFNMNHSERFDMVKGYAGVEIPPELVSMVEGEPACIILDYSQKPTLLSNGASDNIIIYGLPCEKLMAHRIAICDEIKPKERWLALADEIDIACLLVNATMAMNQVERTWLGECGQPLFWENEPVLAMVGMNLLNNAEDVQAVTEVVSAALKRLQMSTKVFDRPQDAMTWMEDFLNGEPIQESRARRIAKNGLTAMSELVRDFMNTAVVDGDTIETAVSQLEKQRKSLEMAGELASESILFNELNRLKVMATETIRDYGRRMAEDIKAQVETYPLEQLGTVDETVNRNAAEAWDSIIKSMSATTDAELAKVAARLTEQMEHDAGTLISQLDEPARRAVYSAISFRSAAADGNAAQMSVRTPAEYAGVNVGELTGQLRRETRNMMLLSIPLLLVNPWVAIGNIFASKAIGKFRTDSELKSARADMAAQIDSMCVENAEVIVRYMESEFDRQIREGRQNVKAAYAELIKHLEENLYRLKNEQGQKGAAWDVLEEQIRVVIPALMTQL